jgi:hypothetical protein
MVIKGLFCKESSVFFVMHHLSGVLRGAYRTLMARTTAHRSPITAHRLPLTDY